MIDARTTARATAPEAAIAIRVRKLRLLKVPIYSPSYSRSA